MSTMWVCARVHASPAGWMCVCVFQRCSDTFFFSFWVRILMPELCMSADTEYRSDVRVLKKSYYNLLLFFSSCILQTLYGCDMIAIIVVYGLAQVNTCVKHEQITENDFTVLG